MKKYRIIKTNVTAPNEKELFTVQRRILGVWFTMFWYANTLCSPGWRKRQYQAYSDALEFIQDQKTPKREVVVVV